MLPGSPRTAFCPEPVTRNGLLLAYNGCRLSAASIPGSKRLTCYFASFQIVPVPGPPLGSTTATRIAPVAAASLPGARCTSTAWSGLPLLLPPLPSGTVMSLGIKAFNSARCLPVHLTNPPDSLSLPAARSSESWGCRSSFQGRYVSAARGTSAPSSTCVVRFGLRGFPPRVRPAGPQRTGFRTG
jgi:hypothetical protein